MDTTTVRRIERSDIPAAARALGAAFYDDPICTFAWPKDDKRLRRGERNFASQMDALWDRREVYADEHYSSVAVWARPDEWEIPLKAIARVAATSVATRLRPRAQLA